jgi:predicted dehydrogenase
MSSTGSTVRFAFAGLGRASRVFHVPALKLVPGALVVGGFDPAPERRAEWESLTGTPSYDSLDALVDAGAPDALVVATPPDSHAELCLRGLEAGLAIYCEKPFAESVEDADRVIAAAERAGRPVAVNHEFREKPMFRAVRDGCASGDYGRLVFCQIWQLMQLAPWDEPTAWRSRMANRTLLEGGVHLVDLLLTIFAEPPKSVFAAHSAGFHEQQDADPVHLVTVEFGGGRLGQITIDRLCKAGTRYLEVRADCEEASLRASLGGRVTAQLGIKRAERSGVRLEYGLGGLAWAEVGTRRTLLARAPRDVGVRATASLLSGFATALATGGEPPSSAREAREGLAVIEAAYRSAATGARVDLVPLPVLAHQLPGSQEGPGRRPLH